SCPIPGTGARSRWSATGAVRSPCSPARIGSGAPGRRPAAFTVRRLRLHFPKTGPARGAGREEATLMCATRAEAAAPPPQADEPIDWPARARQLAPRIAAAADEIERSRRLPADLLYVLHEAA